MKNRIQEIRERQALRRKAMDSQKLVIFRSDGLPVVISNDGGPGSGNFGHKGVPGQVGGSAPSADSYNAKIKSAFSSSDKAGYEAIRKCVKEAPVGTKIRLKGRTVRKVGDNKFECTVDNEPNKSFEVKPVYIENMACSIHGPDIEFQNIKAEDIASAKAESGELAPEDTSVRVSPDVSKKLPQKRSASGNSAEKPTFSGSEKTEGVRSFGGIKWNERNEILKKAPVGSKIEGIVSNSGHPVRIEKTNGIVSRTSYFGSVFKNMEEYWTINGDKIDGTAELAEIIGQTLKGTSKYYKLKG